MADFTNMNLERNDLEEVRVTIDLTSVLNESIEDGEDIKAVLDSVSQEYQMEYVVDFLEANSHNPKLYTALNDRIYGSKLYAIAASMHGCIDEEPADEAEATTRLNSRLTSAAHNLELLTERLAYTRNAPESSHVDRLNAHDRLSTINNAISTLEDMTTTL